MPKTTGTRILQSSPPTNKLPPGQLHPTIHDHMEDELEVFIPPTATGKVHTDNIPLQREEMSNPASANTHSKGDHPIPTSVKTNNMDGYIYIDNSKAGEKALFPFLGRATYTKEPRRTRERNHQPRGTNTPTSCPRQQEKENSEKKEGCQGRPKKKKRASFRR